MFRPGKNTESLNDMGQLSTIKYVIVEMIRNDPSTPVVSAIKKGLFKGIKCEEGNADQKIFVLLENADGVIYILNTEYYNVLSVERSDGVYKYVTFFQAHKSDQDLGYDLLASTVVKLSSENKTLAADSNIIDTKEYEGIPALFKTKSKDSNMKTGASSNFNNERQHSSAATHQKFRNDRKTYDNKPPEPKEFKRNGRKLNTNTINKMREKIVKLLDGEIEPRVPKLDEDETIQVDKVSKTDTAVYNSDYNCMCY